MIRNVKESDAEAICDIYNKYIEDTGITFEETPLQADEMVSRIGIVTQNYPWLVYEENERVLGYTYASKWKERAAYRYSVETAIYLDSDHVGKGIGSLLIDKLLRVLETLEDKSIHGVIYGVALPNPASVALCEKFGFQKIAHFKEVGYKFKKWIDVGYWELIINETKLEK
jgi:L-amino acid N-acyltransferase YncA